MLAVLAEEGRSAADARSLEHLTQCRSCMAAYADAVRYRTAWLGSPEMFDADAAEASPPRSKSRSLANWLPIAAGLLVAVGIGAWALTRRPAPAPTPTGAIAALL